MEASEAEELNDDDYEDETPYTIRRVIHDHGPGGPQRDEADGDVMDSPMNGEPEEEDEAFQSFDYDLEDEEVAADAEEPGGEEGEKNEGSESDVSFNTDYGSLGIIADEDEDEYMELGSKGAYEDFRFQCLADERGVEHYILYKLSEYRSMPMTEDVWNAIRELLRLQRDVQLGGPKIRRLALNYLRDRRRYQHLSLTLDQLIVGRHYQSVNTQTNGLLGTMDGQRMMMMILPVDPMRKMKTQEKMATQHQVAASW